MIENILEELKKGKFILLYDADEREGETDLVIASEFVSPENIKKMRKDAGGLICLSLYYPIAKKLKLPLLVELYEAINNSYDLLKYLAPYDIPYDAKSSFSLTINHRKTFTGISDKDRALTISEFAKLIKNYTNENLKVEFGKNFRSPGHVPILRAAENLLAERRGHTELSVALMLLAGLTPSATICEMIAEDGSSLSKQEAKNYAARNSLLFIEGKDVIAYWEKKWLE
jgi:3,4-dihydroxy 2-butanone 4-phosphate synthase